MIVEMPYIGSALSVNHYHIGRTNKIKPETAHWMKQLAEKVEGCGLHPPVLVKLRGEFRSGKPPDLHNLHKVIGDAVADGLGINDREIRFEDIGYETGVRRPILVLDLQEVE